MEAPAPPSVLVVLVVHDGARWLPRTLAALEEQTHPGLDVVAVDNGSTDASRLLLLERLGEDRVLVADRDLGFGAAVGMGLDARAGREAPYVLLLHDDCALEPQAIARLVAEMEADPGLAIVGPKLRDWDDTDQLQSAGWTVDLTGRADSGVDEGELDQGQRDQERRTLYVSTAGMLLRRDALERLGRFDRRFHVFRDDLDLCWRAWLAGHTVEVVPEAVGYHVAGATNYLRLGQTRFLGPRYFSERNTLATLLKNYAAPRLLVVVPLYFLVGIAKVFGFLLTRRVSDAWQTIRAWLWNVLHLVETLRMRRGVQRQRRRTDAELRALFGRIVPRVRAYAEAIGDWVAGGDVPATEPAPVEPAEREPAPRRSLARLRRRPVLIFGSTLAVVVLVGAIPLLLPGSLRGGDLAPWPVSPAAFLGDYASSWSDAGAFGSYVAPSPAQAVLGLTHLLTLGNEWLAPRLVLLGAPAAAWVLALRATQAYSGRRPARVAAALSYVLSPPALAALVIGNLGGLALLATLPGIVAAGSVALRDVTPPDRAWRAVAAVVLLGAIAGAFAPVVLPALLLAVLVAMSLSVGLTRDHRWRRAIVIRSVVAGLGPWLLLLPWSARLLLVDGPLLRAGGEMVTDPLWRWMLLAPDLPGFPGPVVGAGFALAGLLGLALGASRRPGLVGGLFALGFLGSLGGWAAGRVGALPWPGLPLIVAAAAYAALLAVAFASAEAVLARHEFGWRHLGVAGAATAVLLSIGAVGATLLLGPWERYAVADDPLPSFVVAAAEEEPFRALVLSDGDDGPVWDVVDGAGPSMAAYGVESPPAVTDEVTATVEAMLQSADAGASGRLGTVNVRFVIVPPDGVSDRLDALLREQVALEPRPVAEGRVLRVGTWLPRASVLDEATAETLRRRGEAPPEGHVQPLARVDDGYGGSVRRPGVLHVAEAPDDDWEVTVDGREVDLEQGPVDGTLRAEVAEAGSEVEVVHAGELSRRLAVSWQVLAVLLTISLALRPPGFARAVRREDVP